jgi:hypothetical protein
VPPSARPPLRSIPPHSLEGRARQKKKVAAAAVEDFQKSNTLRSAKDLVERQIAKWAEETGLAIKPPANFADVMLQAEIRAHLAAMKGNKVGFLGNHATDPRVASAVLGAPSFLSGLTDTEVAFVKQKVEQHTAPEIAEARDAALKAMKEAEAGWQRALEKIGEHAGLTRRRKARGRRRHNSSECGGSRRMRLNLCAA